MSTVRTRRPSTPAVADVRRTTRRLAAFVLPIGPAAVALLRFVVPYDALDAPSTIVAKVAADPDTQSLVLWLGLIAVLTLVPAALWVGRLTRPRAPRMTAAALLLLVPGYLALPWMISLDVLVLAGTVAGLDQATLISVLEARHPTVELAELLFVLGHVLGTILLGIALWISRTVPRWAAALTIASQPLHVIAAVILASNALDLAAWSMQVTGFGAAAFAVIRLRDPDWDLAPAARQPLEAT